MKLNWGKMKQEQSNLDNYWSYLMDLSILLLDYFL